MATASNQDAGPGLEAIYAAKLVEGVAGIAWAADPAGNFTYVTPIAPAFRGLTLGQLNSATDGASGWKFLTHPDDYGAVMVAWNHALKTGAPYEIDLRLVGATGAHLWMHATGQPLHDDDGRIMGWYGCVLDGAQSGRSGHPDSGVPDKCEAQSLARASHAAGLAELAASVAHEVNQPLAAVVANAHACQRWLMATPPRLDRAKMTVDWILRDANAAADVVKRKRELFLGPQIAGASA